MAFAPATPTRLLVSSWDKNVYLYDTHAESDGGAGTLIRTFEHRAPVLDVCFGATDNEAFSGGTDWTVKRLDLETGEQTTIGKHSQAVRRVAFSQTHSLLVSASWDSTLQVHNLSTPDQPPLTVPLPGKPHALAVSPSKVVVAMTSRLVHIYDLSTLSAAIAAGSLEPPQPWQARESSLKFLTRAVAAMPSDAGYATSSIEGRVAVEWFDASEASQSRKYAFKCHRTADADGTDVVFPVNALAFHPNPAYGTFASAGGDATVALWDAEAKRRMKIYQKFPDSVASVAFSCDGKYLAVGVCPGFETGMEDYSGEGRTKVIIRELGENEAKPKGAK